MSRPKIGFKRLLMRYDYDWSTGKAVRKEVYGCWDGKPKRCPKEGEFYISGAIPAAYKAINNMTTEYFIAVVCEE